MIDMKIRLECKGTAEDLEWIFSQLAKHTNQRGEIIGTLWKMSAG